jgi:N-acyl-D-amino-acid deacylase
MRTTTAKMTMTTTFDLIITGGTVLDGTGSDGIAADLGVIGDRIASIGDLSGAETKETINAVGKTVTPGFIDSHSHSDAYLLIEPSAQSKISQGITTEITGNCGGSAAPLLGDYQMPSDWREHKYPGTWSRVGEYRDLLESIGPAPNVVLLAGHKAIRVAVVGHEHRDVRTDELIQMKELLAQCIDEGARGMSTGLIYSPGMAATQEELVELSRVVAERGGVYASHMRNEGSGVVEAVEEALEIGRQSGARVQVSHLKAAGQSNWHLIDKATGLIRDARASGQEVAADRYPYTSGSTELDVVFPDWAEEGGRDAIVKRLQTPADRERLRKELGEARTDEEWACITIGSTFHKDNRQYRGMPLPDVAEKLGLSIVDAILHLVETDRAMTGAFFFGMSDDNMMKVLAEPYVMIGSDASLRALSGPLSKDYPHPRAYGSFPKVLRMALDGKTVSLREAVRKMTSLPASQFGLDDRGTIARHKKADIVVFDSKTVCDTADYGNPHSLSLGIEHVIVNGVKTLENGKATGIRGGRFL